MIQTSILVYKELYEKTQEWCKENDRSFGWLVRAALDQFLSSSK